MLDLAVRFQCALNQLREVYLSLPQPAIIHYAWSSFPFQNVRPVCTVLNPCLPYTFSSMSPIQVLPAEILGVVFQLLVDAQLDRNPHTFTRVLSHHRSKLRILITASHVCKLWRALVLNNGTLWVYIPIDPSRRGCWEATKFILRRSKQAELDVSMSLDASCGPSLASVTTMTALSAQYARIRSLYLSTDLPVSLFRGPGPATAMRVLEIFNRSGLYRPVAEFGGTFPNLRSLTLHGFSSWPSDPIPNLTHVKLKSVSAKSSFKLSRLINLLGTSPGLETVHLSSYLSVVSDLSVTDVVYLRNLRTMSLRTCDSATILSHVAIPKTSTLDIVMNHRRLRAAKPSLSHETSIISSLPPGLNNMHFSIETTKLILEQDRLRGGFGLGLSFLNSCTSSLVIVDCSSSIERFVQRSLDAISSHPYFEISRSVTVALPRSTPIHWPTFLGRFGHLLELNTSVHHGSAVLTTLMRPHTNGTPLCPSLRRIRFFERDKDAVPYTAFDHRLLKPLSDFRATFHCEPIRVTVHDGKR